MQKEESADVELVLRQRVRRLKKELEERDARIAELAKEAESARERIAILEKLTDGRQTHLGVETRAVKEEAFREVRIV